jgi:hypothetical protein
MTIVPRTTTPEEPEAATRLVSDAWQSVLGRRPTVTELALVMALVWIETSRGTAIQNHNLGNITAAPSFRGDAWRPPWFDLEGGTAATDRNIELHEAMLRGEAPSAFRAYPTAEAGAADFVRTLRGSFPEVMAAASVGSVDGFRAALAQRYSRDYARDPVRTNAALGQFQREFSALAEGRPELATPESSSMRNAVIALGLVGAGAATFIVLRPARRRGVRHA